MALGFQAALFEILAVDRIVGNALCALDLAHETVLCFGQSSGWPCPGSCTERFTEVAGGSQLGVYLLDARFRMAWANKCPDRLRGYFYVIKL